MPNLNNISESAVPAVDRKAQQEEDNFIAEARRKNRMEAATNWAGIFFIWAFMFLVLSIIGIRIYHMLVSPAYQWLSKEQLSRLDEFFVYGSIGGIIVGFLRSKVLDKK